MANKIQIKRGLKSNLPVLSVGEFGLCTDTKEVFIGTSSGNVGIASVDHIHDFTHNHDDIYYTKLVIDALLNNKSDSGHNHDSRYYTETEVDDLLADKSDEGHTHTDKADKSYVDGELTKKANTTALTGHTGNTAVHVTQTDKNNWNGKADISSIPTKTSQLTNDSGFITSSAIPNVPTKTSDLTNDSGFITISDIPDVPPSITVGTTKPTDGSMWYKVIG